MKPKCVLLLLFLGLPGFVSITPALAQSQSSVPAISSRDSSDSEKSKGNTNCDNLVGEIRGQKDNILKALASLEALLGEREANPNLPSVEALFSFDLSDPAQVEAMQKKLAKLVGSTNETSPAEFQKYVECTLPAAKALLAEVIQAQAALNQRKLNFLKVEKEKRDELIAQYEARRQKPVDNLQNQIASSQAALSLAQQELNQDQELPPEQLGGDVESVLEAKSKLDNFLVGLEAEHLIFVQGLQAKKIELQQISKDLRQQVGGPEPTSVAEVTDGYRFVTAAWQTTVDHLLDLFSKVSLQSRLDVPEKLNLKVISEGAEGAFAAYNLQFQKVEQRNLALTDLRAKLLSDLRVQTFRVLQDAGTLRAELLAKCDRLECDRPRGLNENNISTIMREIRVVPLRFFAGGLSKWVEIRGKATAGFDGWLDLARQISILAILLLIPFFLSRGLRIISVRLNLIKRELLSKSMIDYRRCTSLAVWISRLNPFVPSVGMIASIGLARFLVAGTDFRELSGILYYFQIYYFYCIVNLLLVIVLELVFATESVEKTKLQMQRIEKTANRISRLVFVEYVLLHLTADTVRKALAYNFFANAIFWINIFFVVLEANQWRNEITKAFADRFPRSAKFIQRILSHKISALILPILFCAVVMHDLCAWLAQHLIRLDLVKRLLSEVFRKRLERADDEKGEEEALPPTADYREKFDYYLPATNDILVVREDAATKEAARIVKAWVNGKGFDDLIILVGNRGMGKTTALKHLSEGVEGNCEVQLTRFAPRIVETSELFLWLSTLFKADVQSIGDVFNVDQKMTTKSVIFVDDLHNLFLGTLGGFRAYRTFLEIVSLKTKNILWCLTVNSRAWAYLKGVFGEEHFYGQVLALTPWRDTEIQKLILTRHNTTGYSRSFDESIKAYGANETLGQQAEAQFFRLLWGQSRGNPRSALMYWVSALSSAGAKRVHVGIPAFVSSSLVGSMSDEALFLLSAVTKHENLTAKDLHVLTGIDRLVIGKCLKEAFDKGLIWFDETERIRISSRAQYIVDYFLIGKNFLYE